MIKKLRRKLNGDIHLKDLIKGSVITFFLKMGGMLLSYVLIFLISKKFGPSGVGTFNLFNQTLTVISMFIGLGINISVLRFVGQFNNIEENTKMHLLYGYIVKLIAPSSLLICFLLIIFSDFISIFFTNTVEKSTYFKILGIALPFFALNQVSVEFVRGLKKLQISELIRSVLRPFVMTLGLLILWNRQAIDVNIVIFLFLAGSIINSIVSSYTIRKNLNKIPKSDESNFKIQELLKTSFPMMAVSVSSALMVALPIFVLDFIGTKEEVGIFSVAFKVSQIITLILMIVNTMSAPKFAELFWANKKKELQKLLNQSAKLMFWIALFFSIFVILFAEKILGLFGNEFREGSLILIILVFGQLVNAATGSVGVLLNMSGNQKIYRKAILAVVVVFIIACPIATIFFGIIGTAIITTIAIISINVWLVVKVRKKLMLKTSYPI
jgi:O-antigen/teichoic acid export membrane protein